MKEGYYWELEEDGEFIPQNRCPRRFIKEDPTWWSEIMMAYNGFEKGLLPSQGGLDDQPALFQPIMAIISSALEDERNLEEEKRKKQDALVQKSRQGSTPLGPPNPGRRR